MSEKQAATDRGTYRAAVIRIDGTSTYWTLEGVTAEQAAAEVRERSEPEEAPILIATVCRAGTYSPRRVTVPAAGRTTIHWAACGEYNVTAIDGHIYAIDPDGEPYVDLLDGHGETYIEYGGPAKECTMDERCEAAATACAAHAGITRARHVFEKLQGR